MKVFVYTMIAVCAVGNALHAGDFELLIIGDSITAGVDGTVSGETIPARASYRPDLYDELDAGVPSSYTGVKFVGPNDYHQGSDLLKHAHRYQFGLFAIDRISRRWRSSFFKRRGRYRC